MMRRATVAIAALLNLWLLGGCSDSNSNSQDGLTSLENIDQLRSDFERDQRQPRLILLLSPTCPDCIVGASWVQTYLKNHPQTQLRVYAISFSVLSADRRSKWDPDLLTDPRVKSYWDADQSLGRWLAEKANQPAGFEPHFAQAGRLVWDTYLLFDQTSRWDDKPTALRSSGGTIIGKADRLDAALDQLPTT